MTHIEELKEEKKLLQDIINLRIELQHMSCPVPYPFQAIYYGPWGGSAIGYAGNCSPIEGGTPI